MKKFLSYFNIFDLNLSSRSYKSGLIRIGVSAIAMLILSLFRLSITLTNPIINLIISILVIGGMVLSILCLFVAAVECLQVSENRKNNK
jgi:hypothetical protein